MGLPNKINELCATADILKPDVIGVTETHFSPGVPSAIYNLTGYILHRADREHGTHGGAAFYIKSSLTATLSGIHVDPMGEWESLWCTVMLPMADSVKNIEIGCFYRIPSKPLPNHWDSFYSALLNSPATVSSLSVLIMGDFNFPTINWKTCSSSQSEQSASSIFLSFLQVNALNQAAVLPTRHRLGQQSISWT
jgi:hypothetical protein